LLITGITYFIVAPLLLSSAGSAAG
jgi:hypothetical protein